MKVLMQNRQNALTAPGGDTVVMMRVAQCLQQRGIHIRVDVDRKETLSDYDIVHLHNFATPEDTESLARRCVEANIPYIVTTMYEDKPLFFNQMIEQADAFFRYIQAGQPRERFEEFMAPVHSATPATCFDNTWTANHAAALVASGMREKETLERDYPNCTFVTTYRLGSDIVNTTTKYPAVRELTGNRDFVLCVGRLEARKNQLMLLKALEDIDIPVVFATSGFTYQPRYAQACQAFKRRQGQTVFLQALPPEDLNALFSEALVHALPSWYELPGIVSQEAAKLDANVVVTDYGTPRDYLGNEAFYCAPDDPGSIRNAVVDAFNSPLRPGLARQVADCTWENAATRVHEIYQQVLGPG
jgi:glycosyltransferase involved in cell wall biosynthesis